MIDEKRLPTDDKGLREAVSTVFGALFPHIGRVSDFELLSLMVEFDRLARQARKANYPFVEDFLGRIGIGLDSERERRGYADMLALATAVRGDTPKPASEVN